MRPQQPPQDWECGRQPQQRQSRQPCSRTVNPKLAFRPYHAANVPKSVDLRMLAPASSLAEQTTVMLRNIPNRYSQAQLLQEIDEVGFDGKYDFFYLPMDTHNKTNVGYAFINFVCPDVMQQFIRMFSGYRFKDHSSHKVARVSPAHLQGFLENVQHFSNRAVTHARNSQYRPIVVIDGQHMDMSEAVSRLLANEYNRWWQQGCEAALPETSDPSPCSLAAYSGFPVDVARTAMVADGSEEISPSAQWLGDVDWASALENTVAYDCAAAYDYAGGCDWAMGSPDMWAGGDEQWPTAPWLVDGQAFMCGAPCDVAAVGSYDGVAYGCMEAQGAVICQTREEAAAAAGEAEPAFSVDRSGLERVMSQWLEDVSNQDEDKTEPQEADASSTAGDTPTLSSNASHRSLSPTLPKETFAAEGCGVWDLPSVLGPSHGRGKMPCKR